MKKFVKLFAVAATALLAVSCGKGPKIDSSKWLDSLNDGLTAATNENKKVLVFFSVDDQDGVSADLKQSVFSSDDFVAKYTKDYVLVNLDYSNSLFAEVQTLQSGSEEEQKKGEELIAKIENNMVVINMYNVETSPAFYVLSKQGFVEALIDITSEDNTLAAVDARFAEKETAIAEFDNMLKATSKGSKTDKINAIEALFEASAPQHRQVLTPLSEELIKLDPKNESGLVGKHVVSVANSNAIKAYVRQDPETASSEFVKAAENQYVESEDRQGAYYTAGYLLAQSGSQDYQTMVDLFEKSYEAAPESEHAQQIKQMIEVVKERMSEAATLPFQLDNTVEETKSADGQ